MISNSAVSPRSACCFLRASKSSSGPSISVDGALWGHAYAQSTGGQLVTIALPNDGSTHTVMFHATGYTGYSGSDSTPTTGMYTTIVNYVRVYGPYSLSVVAPTGASSLCLVDGDSISIGSHTNFPMYDGIYARLRANSGSKCSKVIFNSFGGSALYHELGCNPGAGGGSSTTCTSTAWANGSASNTNAMTPAALANQFKTWYGCPAYFFEERQTNDHGRSLWKASDAATAMSYFWTQWHSICSSTVNYQQSQFYKSTSTSKSSQGDYGTAYSDAAAAQSPNWQTALAASCTGGVNCTNIDVSGTNGTTPGGAGNTNNFVIYNDSSYDNCHTLQGIGPVSLANDTYAPDFLHFSTCGAYQQYYAIFHYVLGWI